MKLSKYFFLSGLFIGLSIVQAHAQNVVLGLGAGSGGLRNVHVGATAGRVSTGSSNSFLGYSSGISNISGYNNSFLGSQSGIFNTFGSNNTFLGAETGFHNTYGARNTFVGVNGIKNTTGSENSFLGYFSGNSNTKGDRNTFLGSYTGKNNIDGSYNTFVGYYSGYDNINGHGNAFLGSYSGYNTTTGTDNVFVGDYSGFHNKTGTKNIFIGNRAGLTELGSNKFYLANKDDNYPLLYGDLEKNILSIGTKYTGTAYKLVVPGPVRATKYDVVSDERLKEQVKSLTNVLARVQQVIGVSYVLKEEAVTGKVAGGQQQASKAVQYGFLAQNIQAVFPELVTEDGGTLAVNYQGMIPVLVEALKSLSGQKDSVAAANVTMSQQIMAMQQRLDTLEKVVRGQKATALGEQRPYRLEQNHPNPFHQSTTIRYQVSEAAQQVGLVITNLQGVEVQRFDQLPAGAGKIQIKAGRLAPGIYVYALFADGLLISSKRMILIR